MLSPGQRNEVRFIPRSIRCLAYLKSSLELFGQGKDF